MMSAYHSKETFANAAEMSALCRKQTCPYFTFCGESSETQTTHDNQNRNVMLTTRILAVAK
jgi:hypothetical protein